MVEDKVVLIEDKVDAVEEKAVVIEDKVDAV